VANLGQERIGDNDRERGMTIGQLGGDFDYVPNAAALLLSLKQAGGVTFFGINADTFTLKSASTYNGSPTPMPTISTYYTNSSLTGAGTWVEQTQATASSVTIASGMCMFYVDGADLPSGGEYVEVTVGGSGQVRAIFGDLSAPRSPVNLPARSGSAS
jgi:hypothetical protein